MVVSAGERYGEEVWGTGPAFGLAIGAKRHGTHARYVTTETEAVTIELSTPKLR